MAGKGFVPFFRKKKATKATEVYGFSKVCCENLTVSLDFNILQKLRHCAQSSKNRLGNTE